MILLDWLILLDWRDSKSYHPCGIPCCTMDEERIRKAFEAYGIVDEITCPQAFEISEKYNIPKMDIARYCNQREPRIKIHNCQLGCFR